ncbi:MAG: hypothetical protein LBC61_02340 [Candidatus Peribacteria bacterium]|nr:hypothetical protein [Candidatus Peribacteria bacterium]
MKYIISVSVFLNKNAHASYLSQIQTMYSKYLFSYSLKVFSNLSSIGNQSLSLIFLNCTNFTIFSLAID